MNVMRKVFRSERRKTNYFQMSSFKEVPVFKACYDLNIEFFNLQKKKLSRSAKYTIGDRLINNSLSLLSDIQRAMVDGNRKIVLEVALERVGIIRVLIRLLKDTDELSTKELIRYATRVENISKQLTGWYSKSK
ncbi:MAG: hypothetical protein COA49_05470 [Bacteroidetes bacterium]|nr:MAG: hypothetical protein COA49_05470 [Bacteroidota bacterium]